MLRLRCALLSISAAGSRSAAPRSHPQGASIDRISLKGTWGSSHSRLHDLFERCFDSAALCSAFRLRVPARLHLAHTRKAPRLIALVSKALGAQATLGFMIFLKDASTPLRFAQHFGCGFPLGCTSLTPARRLD